MSYRGNSNNKYNFSVTSKHDGSRSFKGDHDDRFYTPPRGQRGRGRGRGQSRGRRDFKNFKTNSSRFRNRFGGDEDGDEAMGDDRRGRGASSRRSRAQRRSAGRLAGVQGQRNFNPEKQWYKVTIPFGNRLSQDELFKLIRENSAIEAQFLNYHVMDQRAYFYVQGTDISESLQAMSNRIPTPNGRKLIIMTKESAPPKERNQLTLSQEHIEKLKVRMSDRYDASTRLLNLSSFHNDEILRQENITTLHIQRYTVMDQVVKIITEYIPEVIGLDLSGNRIAQLGVLSRLVKAAPGLTSLNLGENSLRYLSELEKLKGWTNVVELNLDGNSLCNDYTSETEYISAIRKIFPKVVKLDGKDLPPPISFDLHVTSLPATQDSYFMNEEIKNLIVNFVKQYFSIFDSDSRRGLMAAYNENAQFSYQVSRNTTLEIHKQGDFYQYNNDSRNLIKISHLDSGNISSNCFS